MSSRQKRKQARLNGAKAAGTKSPEGIGRSSMNALRHGLTAKAIVLSNESQDEYDALRHDYVKRFSPHDAVEMDLVDDMVAARWRLRRVTVMQTAAFNLQISADEADKRKRFSGIDAATTNVLAFGNLANVHQHTTALLMRYESTYSRMYERAMKSLQKLQKDRLEAEESATHEEVRNDAEQAEPQALVSAGERSTDPQVPPGRSEYCETTQTYEPTGTTRPSERTVPEV